MASHRLPHFCPFTRSTSFGRNGPVTEKERASNIKWGPMVTPRVNGLRRSRFSDHCETLTCVMLLLSRELEVCFVCARKGEMFEPCMCLCVHLVQTTGDS